MTLPISQGTQQVDHLSQPELVRDTVALNFEERLLRRRVLTTVKGYKFLVDFAKTISVSQFDAFVIDNGHQIGVVLALEPLLEVKGNLSRLAWHIGNRHAPCQVEEHRLLIQDDHVIADMLRVLGAETKSVTEPFDPERGAYGFGRTHAHTH